MSKLSFSNLSDLNEYEIFIDNKTLIKIVDFLGRESKIIKNKPLFYIYDDGTVEKKITID